MSRTRKTIKKSTPYCEGDAAELPFVPSTLSRIFISHAHWDHTGGLAELLAYNKEARVYIPESCSVPADTAHVVRVKGPCQIDENVFSTGELGKMEQSLVVKTRKGLVLIAGCSHPGVGAVLEAASSYGRPRALIGGGRRPFFCVQHSMLASEDTIGA